MLRSSVRLLIAALFVACAAGFAQAQGTRAPLPGTATDEAKQTVADATAKAEKACTLPEFMGERARLINEAAKGVKAAAETRNAAQDLAKKTGAKMDPMIQKGMDDVVNEWVRYLNSVLSWQFSAPPACPPPTRTAQVTPRTTNIRAAGTQANTQQVAAAPAATGAFDPSYLMTNVSTVFAITGGIGKGDADTFVTSTNPSSVAQKFTTTPEDVAFDLRLAVALARQFAFVVGVNYMINVNNTVRREQEHDRFSQFGDTVLSLRNTAALATYVGMMAYWPMWAPKTPELRANAAMFSTLIYVGLVTGWYEASLVTNENGMIRGTSHTARQHGWRIGGEIDIPLVFAVVATQSIIAPYLRLGASADFYDAFSFSHRSVFQTYTATIDPITAWRIYVGLAFVLNPPRPLN